MGILHGNDCWVIFLQIYKPSCYSRLKRQCRGSAEVVQRQGTRLSSGVLLVSITVLPFFEGLEITNQRLILYEIIRYCICLQREISSRFNLQFSQDLSVSDSRQCQQWLAWRKNLNHGLQVATSKGTIPICGAEPAARALASSEYCYCAVIGCFKVVKTGPKYIFAVLPGPQFSEK